MSFPTPELTGRNIMGKCGAGFLNSNLKSNFFMFFSSFGVRLWPLTNAGTSEREPDIPLAVVKGTRFVAIGPGFTMLIRHRIRMCNAFSCCLVCWM